MSAVAAAHTPRGAVERLRDVAGPELVERLEALDRLGARAVLPVRDPPPPPPDPGATPDYDVALVGGGLSLVYAPLLAARGARVAVFERHRAGVAHREWNASERELGALVSAGLCEPAELERLIVARYARGTCRWYGGGDYPVTGVLDAAVDAGGLLALARARAEQLGVDVFDGHALESLTPGDRGVRLRVTSGARARELVARVVLDGRGVASSFDGADLLCPTVGGTLTGLAEGPAPDEVDPRLGEILATTDDVEGGRQHLWETFPGRRGESTVYLFYYAPRGAARPGALTALYDRFFSRLSAYKRGEARLLRPTFGIIPGWSRLGPPPARPRAWVLPVGDAAARHSPLTFCGFGATLRSLGPVVGAVERALDGHMLPASAVDDRPIHRGTGALAWLLASPDPSPRRAHGPNALLDAAFAAIHAMGNDAYAALLRDELPVRDFVSFLATTARARPEVYGLVLRRLGPVRAMRWLAGLASELRS